jgi:hypothetical protein
MSARLHFATREGSATERTVFHGVIAKLRAGVCFNGRAAAPRCTTGDFYPKCSVSRVLRRSSVPHPSSALSTTDSSQCYHKHHNLKRRPGLGHGGAPLRLHISERYQKPLHHMRSVTMGVCAGGCRSVMPRVGGCRADCPRQLSCGRLPSPTGPFGRRCPQGRCQILQEPAWHKRTKRVAHMAALL